MHVLIYISLGKTSNLGWYIEGEWVWAFGPIQIGTHTKERHQNSGEIPPPPLSLQVNFTHRFRTARGGGLLGQKVYTPARMALRNPYPHWHKIPKPLPLLAQNLDQNPYPYWHKFIKRLPSVTKLLFKMVYNHEFWCAAPKMWPSNANFNIFPSLWHNQWKNHTLSGTHLLL